MTEEQNFIICNIKKSLLFGAIFLYLNYKRINNNNILAPPPKIYFALDDFLKTLFGFFNSNFSGFTGRF
jgi:hypothetical protein